MIPLTLFLLSNILKSAEKSITQKSTVIILCAWWDIQFTWHTNPCMACAQEWTVGKQTLLHGNISSLTVLSLLWFSSWHTFLKGKYVSFSTETHFLWRKPQCQTFPEKTGTYLHMFNHNFIKMLLKPVAALLREILNYRWGSGKGDCIFKGNRFASERGKLKKHL